MESIDPRRSQMETKAAIGALAALAQDSRLAVFRLLVQVGPSGMAASKIAEQLGVPPSSLSFHLKELTHAGLIVPRQDGRFVIYAANFSTMNALVGFLTESCCGGNPCTPVARQECANGTELT
jgi:ArsR family transcriptional regulator, arsenate/arsenite/antimonite-responsive transcriptional repressor